VASLVDQKSGTLLYFKRISKKRRKVIGNVELKHQMMNNRLLITKDLRGDVVIKTILRKMRKVYIKQFYQMTNYKRIVRKLKVDEPFRYLLYQYV